MTRSDRDTALHQRWRETGDTRARDELVAGLMGIARKVARSAARKCPASLHDDLEAEAALGVVEAVEEWRGKDRLVLFALLRATARVADAMKIERRALAKIVYANGYSSTELISEWRCSGGQEEAALVGEVRAIAARVLPPRHLDLLMLRACDMTLADAGRSMGIDRRRASEREAHAMAAMSDAVAD